MAKKIDIAASGQPIAELRIALRRFLIEFQSDLHDLEKDGLEPDECDKVKAQLAETIEAFERIDKRPHTVTAEISKHFRAYAKLYHDWNGHEGGDQGKAELRNRELKKISERRRKLFRALSKRQAEFSTSPQLTLPFTAGVKTAIATVAVSNPQKFPRLKQASILFG